MLFRRRRRPPPEPEPEAAAAAPGAWRVLDDPRAEVADLAAWPAALAEGRLAGKYLLARNRVPDTVVFLGFREKGVLAGPDVDLDREAAKRRGIAVARVPRSGHGAPKPAGMGFFQDLVRGASRRFHAAPRGPDDPAVLLYTSGTTGRPRGVTLTHGNFAAECAMVDGLLPLKPDDRMVVVLPLYHVYGLADGLVWALHAGIPIALVAQYSPARLLEVIRDFKASVLIAIPTMYQHLLRLAKARKTELPRSLRICVSGGAPLPRAVLQDFEATFGTRIAEGYGLTETTSAVCLNLPGEGYKSGSIGPAPPGVDIRVVDDRGRPLPDGETGEIVIRGGMVMPGYWNDRAATAEAIRDGWFHTGDLGHRDADGCFFVTDRKKDIIIRGGFNISPREIEEVAISHPGVADAAAVPGVDARGRETLTLFAVPAGETPPDPREVLAHCAANLADYKVPRTIVFRDRLPRTATGKILRRELRPDYRDERLLGPESGPSAGARPGPSSCGSNSPATTEAPPST